MLQNKQYCPLDAVCGIQYLRSAEMKVLVSIANQVAKGSLIFDIVTIRENLAIPLSLGRSSVGSAVGALIQLGILADPIKSTRNGFGYTLVRVKRLRDLNAMIKELEVFWTDNSNYRELVELFIRSRDFDRLVNKRMLTRRTKKFMDFLTTIPDLVVVTPPTDVAPQTYAFTNELRFKIKTLLKMNARFNNWRIDGIKLKEK